MVGHRTNVSPANMAREKDRPAINKGALSVGLIWHTERGVRAWGMRRSNRKWIILAVSLNLKIA